MKKRSDHARVDETVEAIEFIKSIKTMAPNNELIKSMIEEKEKSFFEKLFQQSKQGNKPKKVKNTATPVSAESQKKGGEK